MRSGKGLPERGLFGAEVKIIQSVSCPRTFGFSMGGQ